MFQSRFWLATSLVCMLSAACSLANSVDEPSAPALATGGSGGTASTGGGGAGGAPECDGPLTTLEDCGECDAKCEPLNVNGATCETGTCGYKDCVEGFQDCDQKASTGCESQIATDVAHCGGCDMPCDLRQFKNVENVVCDMGACGYDSCSALFDTCDQDETNGCETPINTLTDCGVCGQLCEPENIVNPDCSTGMCKHGGCTGTFGDCDQNEANGCEVDLNASADHCGSCNKMCANNEVCQQGTCIPSYRPVGPQTGVLASTVTQGGWSQCFAETYGSSSSVISTVLAVNCTKKNLMMACRKIGAKTINLLAWAPRTDVTTDTMAKNTPHNANGVGWYFGASHSWGFALKGDPLSLGTCDIQNVNSQFRLCWHTGNGVVTGGYRCGSEDSLNSSQAYERIIFHAD